MRPGPSGADSGLHCGGGRQAEVRPRLFWSIAVLIVLAGGVLRFAGLGRQSYWVDELMTLAASTGHFQTGDDAVPEGVLAVPSRPTGLAGAGPWTDLWRPATGDVHPPLFYTVLRGWRVALGEGDVAARALPATASLVALALVMSLACQLFGPRAALWCGALSAVAPTQVAFAQEMRSYTLAMALLLGASVALMRLKTAGPGWARAATLAACVLGAALTHYFALGTLVALALYAALALEGRARRVALVAFALAAALFLALAGELMWAQRHNVSQPWLVEHGITHVISTAVRVAAVPVRLLLDVRWSEVTWPAAWVAGALALSALWVLPPLLLRRDARLLLPCLWLSTTVGLVLGLDLIRSTNHLSFTRYTFLASPAVCLLLVGLLWQLPGRWKEGLALAALVVLAGRLPSYYAVARKADWRGFGAYLARRAGPTDVIVVSERAASAWYSRCLLMGVSHYAYSPTRRHLVLRGSMTAAMAERVGRLGDAWLLGEAALKPTPELPGSLLPGGAVVDSGAWTGVATWWRVRLGAREVPAANPPRQGRGAQGAAGRLLGKRRWSPYKRLGPSFSVAARRSHRGRPASD